MIYLIFMTTEISNFGCVKNHSKHKNQMNQDSDNLTYLLT
jgi:hypothetical protein